MGWSEPLNILEKIKLALNANNFVNEEIKEAKAMDSASGKPGYKTTEFWFNLAAQAALLWGTVQHFVPPQYAAIISIGGIALYTVARTVAKAVSDIQAAKAASTTVSTTAPVTTVTTPT